MTKKEIIFLLSLLALAFFLRIQGNSFGLPYRYHIDEPATIGVAVGFGSGDFNPHYFFHPNLLHYLLFIVYGFYFVLGKMTGVFHSLTEFKNLFFLDPSSFYLIGRTIGAIFGTMTVFLVFILGKKFYNKKVGFLAALFLTFTFLHARSSHYARHDIPVTFFIILAYLFILNIIKNGRRKDYLLSGFLTGLAISTNWNAILLIPLIFMAHFFARNKDTRAVNGLAFNRMLFLALCMVILGLFCGSPYIFLDFKSFYSGGFVFNLDRLLRGAQSIPISSYTGKGWVFIITHSLFYGLGWPLLILSLMGSLHSLYKHSAYDLTLLSFPLIYYLFLGKMSSGLSDEYTIPFLPFLAIFASRLFVDSISKLKLNVKLKKIVAIIMICLFIFIPSKFILRHNRLLLQPDTRTQAKAWIEQNIPKGSKIAMEKYVYAGSEIIPLAESKHEKQERLRAILKENPLKGKFTSTILELPYPETTYELIEITPYFHMLREYENYYDYEQLKKQGVEFVVLHTYVPSRLFKLDTDDYLNFFTAVESHGKLIKEFNPFDFKEDSNFNISRRMGGRESKHTPFDNVSIRKCQGPWIKIYKLI